MTVDEEKLAAEDAAPPPKMQFSLGTLLLLPVAAGCALAVLFTKPTNVAAMELFVIAFFTPAGLTGGIVYGKGYTRAFCIGALFPVAALSYCCMMEFASMPVALAWDTSLFAGIPTSVQYMFGGGWLAAILSGCMCVGIPVRLTKEMIRHFMLAPDHYSVEEAFRWGQIRGLGGEPALVEAVNSTRLVRTFDHEAYWIKVIAFFVHFAELVFGHIGPIVEYLRFHKSFYKLETPLPEKGRAVKKLLDNVAKWQPTTKANSGTRSIRWDNMGIKELEYDEIQGRNRRTWTIRELLDNNELIVEGRIMRHCVARYVGRCVKQRSSIWSMSCYSCTGQEHILTIEVDPGTRTIVQAKGKRDSLPTQESRRIMLRWARQERLKVAYHV